MGLLFLEKIISNGPPLPGKKNIKWASSSWKKEYQIATLLLQNGPVFVGRMIH
jgi:hypothetical protein